MNRFIHIVKSVARRDDAQDLLEYALLVALIALVAVGAVAHAGYHTNEVFELITAAI